MKPFSVVIIAVVVAVLGFFGGMKYEESVSTANRQNMFGQFGQGQAGQNARRQFSGRPVNGEIISVGDNSITVKMPDGQSKIVLINDSTQIREASNASKSDLKQGSAVAVFGSQNSDGSITAQNVELNPQFLRFANLTPTQSP